VAVDGPRLSPVLVTGGDVLSEGQRLSVAENESVNITCQVDARPAPSADALRWYRYVA